jgi:hypothetical protein
MMAEVINLPAISKTEIACSLDTEGKSSKKSAKEFLFRDEKTMIQ